MKTLTPLLIIILTNVGIYAQTTINPSCYSNARGWTVTKVDNKYDGTYVYLHYYSYRQNYEFLVSSGMYIENYKTATATKYYVKSFQDNAINTKYKLDSYTDYNFVLKFEKIPSTWTDINIGENPIEGYTAFYWKYITLNSAPDKRLKIDNFFLKTGIPALATFAHPLNNFKKAEYNIDYNAVRVTLYYQEGYTVDLRIVMAGNYFSSVDIMYDDDYDRNSIWAFSGLSLLRNAIFNQDNYQKDISSVERIIGKYVNEMSGEELATAILNLSWIAQ